MRQIGLMLIFFILAIQSNDASCKELPNSFFAYYTHLASGEAFEKYSRTGEYADIVVNITPRERLVFWRGAGYLPYLETDLDKWPVEELVPRSGDGSETMPDAVNMFSHVAIVENSVRRIVILWRYLPRFKMNRYPHYPVQADPLTFVEEVFSITADGKVERVVRQGTKKIDDWENPFNRIRQTFCLTPTGIMDLQTQLPEYSASATSVKGNPVKNPCSIVPVLAWHFDEGRGDETLESVTRTLCPIEGHKSLWKKGVSGTALQFDGYTSLIKLQGDKAPLISGGLTLEAWIALGAYPWNWAPIIEQGDSAGYALGIDGHGFPGVRVMLGGKVYELLSSRHLERNQWYHLAAAYNPSAGKLFMLINGQATDSLTVPQESFTAVAADVRIAMSAKARAACDPVRADVNFPTVFTVDGLLDEIRVYDRALSADQIEESYRCYNPGQEICRTPDMQIRQLPVPLGEGKFRAYYTHLNYYETWDNLWRFGDYPDVVVEFDEQPTKFIFWKGTNYIPCMANDKNQWYSNEFNETWQTGGGSGCQEPMSDKNLLTTHVRIVEQSPARVVIHWRVALMDTKNNIQANYDSTSNWGDWSDWYYTIYPDGVAVKRMRLWSSGQINHEWQEGMVILGENTRPEEVIEQSPVYYFVDDSGRVSSYDWKDAYLLTWPQLVLY
jgi:hypothetical protein